MLNLMQIPFPFQIWTNFLYKSFEKSLNAKILISIEIRYASKQNIWFLRTRVSYKEEMKMMTMARPYKGWFAFFRCAWKCFLLKHSSLCSQNTTSYNFLVVLFFLDHFISVENDDAFSAWFYFSSAFSIF